MSSMALHRLNSTYEPSKFKHAQILQLLSDHSELTEAFQQQCIATQADDVKVKKSETQYLNYTSPQSSPRMGPNLNSIQQGPRGAKYQALLSQSAIKAQFNDDSVIRPSCRENSEEPSALSSQSPPLVRPSSRARPKSSYGRMTRTPHSQPSQPHSPNSQVGGARQEEGGNPSLQDSRSASCKRVKGGNRGHARLSGMTSQSNDSPISIMAEAARCAASGKTLAVGGPATTPVFKTGPSSPIGRVSSPSSGPLQPMNALPKLPPIRARVDLPTHSHTYSQLSSGPPTFKSSA